MSGFHGKRPSKKPSKYVRGDKIESLIEFILRLEQRLPFYCREKFMAAGFIEQWSFVQVRQSIKFSNLYCAEKREQED